MPDTSIPVSPADSDLKFICHAPRRYRENGRVYKPEVYARCGCGKEYRLRHYNFVHGVNKRCIRCKVKLGARYNKLVIVKELPWHVAPDGREDRRVLCQCDCGNQTEVRLANLRNNHTQSCGCLQIQSRKTHGFSDHPEYTVWTNMMYRCYNPSATGYDNYGGRGIGVCDDWHDAAIFIKDMGERPDGYEIDRVDNEGDYSPQNCSWVTPSENAINKRDSKIWIVRGVEYVRLKDAAEVTGVHPTVIGRWCNKNLNDCSCRFKYPT